MSALPKITLADLERHPGWDDPTGALPTRQPRTPTAPRGKCLSCGATGDHRYVRKVFSTGTGFHVMAACVTCGCNARGAGQWVARDEVDIMGWRVDDLPTSDTGQGVLL